MRPVNLRAARRALARQRLPRRRLPAAVPMLAAAAIVLAATSPWLGTWAAQAAVAVQRGLGLVVAEVALDGAVRLDDATLLAALDVVPGMPILDVDLAAARARLEAEPWVAAATVRRELPRRIAVEIVEHRPLARWYGAGDLALLAAGGETLAVDPATPLPPLPLVLGDTGPAHAHEIERLVAATRRLGVPVTRLERTGGHRWRLELASGVRIELPAQQPLDALDRLARLQKRARVLDRAVAAIDLRLADRVVLTPRPILRYEEAG